MIPNFGPMEVAVVLGLALIVFGPRRLPSLGRSLGKGISGFRREVNQIQDMPDQATKVETEPEDPETVRQPT